MSRRTLLRLAFACALGLLVLAGLDFGRFVTTLADRPPEAVEAADGIVVLTGGAERIAQGFDLLAEGRARRLLVTGVNQATRAQDLAPAHLSERTPSRELAKNLVNCCVDLDRNALNTLGNALETARWARQNRFSSLIVVTASYHMPRTLMELRRALPDVHLVPYPVVPDGLNLDGWWRDPATARLLAFEYAKYAVASFRLRLDRPTAHKVKAAVDVAASAAGSASPAAVEPAAPAPLGTAPAIAY